MGKGSGEHGTVGALRVETTLIGGHWEWRVIQNKKCIAHGKTMTSEDAKQRAEEAAGGKAEWTTS